MVSFMKVLLAILSLVMPAFAVNADSVAVAISAGIQARHMPYSTGILDPIYASPTSDQIVDYTRCADSAIWTGHYLAAESFRYNVTGDPDALANVKGAVAAIKALMDVTGTNLLARCMVPIDSPYVASIESQEAANGVHTSPGWMWIGNTSRDEYSGAMFGLAVAYELVNDSGVQASASAQISRIVNFLEGNGWNVPMPGGGDSTTFLIRPDEIMSFLQVGKHVNHPAFSTDYELQSVALDAEVPIPIGVDVLSNSSYFKFNLDYINLYDLITLDSGQSFFNDAYSILRGDTSAHQNAFFNMVDRALKGPNEARDDQTAALLSQWLERPARDPYVNLQGGVPACGSDACQPVPVPLRPTTDFLWQRDPFQLAGGGVGTIEGAGIDYILPYWMARYFGVLPRPTVESAASVSLTVAPDSVAVLQANQIDGGSELTVTDAAGVARPATVLYASAGQVDFIVPDGTALGLATFSFDSRPAVSATATVSTVAPTLFTCGASACLSGPVRAPASVTLYGTGIRHASSLSNVLVTVNNVSVPVLYAGAQADDAGLDEIQIALPASLSGSTATVLVTVDGQTANAVRISVE